MRKLLLPLLFLPSLAHAQATAPELFGVGEVVITYAQLSDPKAADACGISRNLIAETLAKSLAGTTVPAIAATDARPPQQGVARIQLIPQITTHADENLDCVSWISLSAESHANIPIPPVATPRSVTVVYWRQQTTTVSGQTSHAEAVTKAIQKMTTDFAQHYKLDQPPSLPK